MKNDKKLKKTCENKIEKKGSGADRVTLTQGLGNSIRSKIED